MLEPKYIDAAATTRDQAYTGWWAVDEAGTLVLGPYPTREAALLHIAERFGTGEIPS